MITAAEARELTNQALFKQGWKIIINPRAYRRRVSAPSFSRTFSVLGEIVARMPKEVADTFSSYYAGLPDNVADCVSACCVEDFINFSVEIEHAFNCVSYNDIDANKAIDFLNFVVRNIDKEEFISQKYNLTLAQTKVLTYYLRAFFPDLPRD